MAGIGLVAALGSSLLSASPAGAQSAPVGIEGVITVIDVHTDPNDLARASGLAPTAPEGVTTDDGQDVYVLETVDGDVPLTIGSLPAGIAPGDAVSVAGSYTTAPDPSGATGDDVTVFDATSVTELTGSARSQAVAAAGGVSTSGIGTRNVLVMPLTWAGATGTLSQATGNARSVDIRNWFLAASEFRLSLNFTVTPQLTTPARSGCPYWTIYNDALAAAQAQGFATGNYNHLIVVVPQNAGCTWAGLASVGGGTSWMNGQGAYSLSVTPHELGHNLGLGHANRWNCVNGVTRIAFTGTCTEVEYGERYDVMGSTWTGQFNVAELSRLTWLRPQSQVTATNGAFTLSPVATDGAVLKTVKIPYNADTLWLSYRSPVGLDTGWGGDVHTVTGVTMHLQLAGDNSWTDTRQVDLTPGVAPRAGTTDMNDRALMPGQQWVDPSGRFIVQVTGMTPTAAAINIIDMSLLPPPAVDNVTVEPTIGGMHVRWTSVDAARFLIYVNGAAYRWTTTNQAWLGPFTTANVTIAIVPYRAEGTAGPVSPPVVSAALGGVDKVAATAARAALMNTIASPGEAATPDPTTATDTPADVGVSVTNGVVAAPEVLASAPADPLARVSVPLTLGARFQAAWRAQLLQLVESAHNVLIRSS